VRTRILSLDGGARLNPVSKRRRNAGDVRDAQRWKGIPTTDPSLRTDLRRDNFLGTDGFQGKAKVIHRSRFNFLREAQIWYSRNVDQPVLSDEFENVIVLSDEFFQEISAHPIPTDLDAVRVLAPSPAVLDLFMWLSYRCFAARREEETPIFGG